MKMKMLAAIVALMLMPSVVIAVAPAQAQTAEAVIADVAVEMQPIQMAMLQSKYYARSYVPGSKAKYIGFWRQGSVSPSGACQANGMMPATVTLTCYQSKDYPSVFQMLDEKHCPPKPSTQVSLDCARTCGAYTHTMEINAFEASKVGVQTATYAVSGATDEELLANAKTICETKAVTKVGDEVLGCGMDLYDKYVRLAIGPAGTVVPTKLGSSYSGTKYYGTCS